MKKRSRIRRLIFGRSRHFHDDKTGHIHVGNRSYQSYEDFAETTSSRQSANTTSSMEEFRQASAETAQLRQDNAPAESARPPAPPVADSPTESRSANIKEPPPQGQSSSNPPRDSFAANTAAPENHSVERFQVPRVFIPTPRVPETPTPMARPEVVANRPNQSSQQDPGKRLVASSGENRPQASGSTAQHPHSSESPPTLNPAPDTFKAAATASQTPTVLVRAEAQAQGATSGSPSKTGWSLNNGSHLPLKSNPTAANLSYAAKAPAPGQALAANLSQQAPALSPKGLPITGLPVPGFPLMGLPLQQPKALPLALATWLNGVPLIRGPESSMLLAVEKKLLRFGDILFGRYTLPSKMGEKGVSDPSLMAQLGLLWMLWKKKNLRARSEKAKFRSESDRAEGSDETKQDENPEHGREGSSQLSELKA